jgi:predicted nucleotidyltransferase
MTRQDREKLKNFYAKEAKKLVKIIKEFNPEKIIQFGSTVKGDFHKGSDLGLCIIMNFRRPHFRVEADIDGAIFDAGYDYKVVPDIHVFKPDELKGMDSLFVQEIMGGKKIYEKD